MSIYVRIRRKQQSFYIFVEPKEHTVSFLKQEIVTALSTFQDDILTATGSASITTDDLKIMTVTGKELMDDQNHNDDDDNNNDDDTNHRSTALSQLINEQELHVVLRISDDEFEPVQIQYTNVAE